MDTDDGGLHAVLEVLHGDSGPGEIEVRTRVPRRQRKDTWPSRWAADPAQAAALANEIVDKGVEVYVGVGRRLERGRDTDAVEVLPAAWVDLDPRDDLTPYELDTYRAVQRRRLAALDHPPSLVISSGRGIHAYWLLTEPGDRDQVTAVTATLTRALSGDTQAAEAARVMRVPGSPNLKTDPSTRARLLDGDPAAPRRYVLADLPLDPALVPTRTGTDRPSQGALLDRVLEVGDGARLGQHGKVTLRCPFHDDRHPSAVVFPGGWLHCSACGVSAPAGTWTRREAVRDWDVAGLVEPGGSREREILGRCLSQPKVVIRDVLPMLLPGHARGLQQAEKAALALVNRQTGEVVQEAPGEALAGAHEALGPQGLPVFLALIAERQTAAWVGPEGEFEVSVDRLGRWLRPDVDAGHRLTGKLRKQVGQALAALMTLHATLRWSSRTVPGRGPLVELVESRGRMDVVRLHPMIGRQMTRRSPARVPWHPLSLTLPAVDMAFVAHVHWERSRRGEDEWVAGFDQALRLAGVPCPWDRLRDCRQRVLEEWARRLGGLAVWTGVGVDAGAQRGHELRVVAPTSWGGPVQPARARAHRPELP